jgi:glyoxylase-like metal-dependent hydrolase (beta-lactamase superfamily II)
VKLYALVSLLALAPLGNIALAESPLSSKSGSPQARATPPDVAMLPTVKTEEGQTVIYDAYTWRRRELTKRLPLSEPWPSESVIGKEFKRFKLDVAPMPEQIPTPSRIMDDVYLVNSEPNLTYLIDAGPGQLVIVDPGLESNVSSILQKVQALGFSSKDIKWVINTHAHFDHAMADAHFQRLGAKILVGREDVYAVEKGTEVTAKHALSAGESANYPTLHVDWPVDDGERLELGDKTFLTLRTPGHTDGSTCYVLQIYGKNVLFGGDTILFDYRLGAQTTPFADNVAYLASLKKLVSLEKYFRWDVLLPGHGTIVLNRAYLDVLKGKRQVQLDVVEGAQVQALPFATDAYRELMFGRP